jgi:hypothetical protein
MKTIETQNDRMTARETSVQAAEPQLELGFEGASRCPSARGKRRQFNRANWWFQRMRQVVDQACSWEPAPQPRPEQIWLPNTRRPLTAAAGLGRDDGR